MEGFGAVYREHFGPVYNYVYLRVRDGALADDLAAEAFRKALTRMDSYSADKASLKTWLFAVARNAVNDHFRRARWRSWLTLEALSGTPSPEPLHDERLAREEDLARVREAIGGLDERERDLIALKFASRLNNREIARMTGLSESNVGTILYRALGRVKERLAGPERE